jgi:hypothetical protein
MKYFSPVALLAAMAALPALAQAPAPGVVVASGIGYGYNNQNYSSSIEEGYRHGIADVVRAAGGFNRESAEAALKHAEAQRMFIENRALAVQTYFDVREINRLRRAAELGPPPTYDSLVRMALAAAPQRLGQTELDTISGRITWPILLRSRANTATRAELETIFANRAVNGTISTEDYLEVVRLTQTMLEDLRSQIAVLPAQQYMVAVRFVESLAYEAGLTPA